MLEEWKKDFDGELEARAGTTYPLFHENTVVYELGRYTMHCLAKHS